MDKNPFVSNCLVLGILLGCLAANSNGATTHALSPVTFQDGLESTPSLVDSKSLKFEKEHDSATIETSPVYQQLCRPHTTRLEGDEGQSPDGTVLDKLFILVVAAKGYNPRSTLNNPLSLSRPTVNCHFHHHAAESSSRKVRSYHGNIHDRKKIGRTKAGLGVFEAIPSTEACRDDDVSPPTLSSFVDLGEYLADRYRFAFPQLVKPGADPVVAGCVAQQPAYQTATALLHGLLNEKQFMRVAVDKLEEGSVRGLGSHNPCPALTDIDIFEQQAYDKGQEIFQHDGPRSFTQRDIFIARNLGLSLGSALPSPKNLIQSLSRWFCEARTFPCQGEKCLNVSEALVNHLLQASAEHTDYLSSNPVFQSYSVSDTHPYLQDLFSWFSGTNTSLKDKNKPGERTQKLEIISDKIIKVDVADDLFFLKLLTALGFRTKDPIFPGSRLVLEQYKKSGSTSPARYLKVMVNGKVVTSDLSSFSGSGGGGELFGLDTVLSQLKEKRQKSLFGICQQSKDEL